MQDRGSELLRINVPRTRVNKVVGTVSPRVQGTRMLGVSLQIAVIVALTLLNGLFAMSETALVSSRKARLRQRSQEGDKGARAALELADSPTRFLSTVQIGISLIGVLAGAFGGAALAGPLAEALRGVPALAPYAGLPLLRRRGCRDHLPIADHRRAGAQAPRPERRGGGGLARGRADAPHLGDHLSRRLVLERLDRGSPQVAWGAPDGYPRGERAGGRDPDGGGRAGRRLRGRRKRPCAARTTARRSSRT